MSAQHGHITSKVILGYLLLILIAVYSVVYIYNIIKQFADEDDPNSKSREKVYLVTNTLSLLYESEALGQVIGRPQGENQPFQPYAEQGFAEYGFLAYVGFESGVIFQN